MKLRTIRYRTRRKVTQSIIVAAILGSDAYRSLKHPLLSFLHLQTILYDPLNSYTIILNQSTNQQSRISTT